MPKKKIISNSIKEKVSSRRGRPKKTLENEQENNGPDSRKTLEALEVNRRQLIEMQNKILSAPAMNGGFSTLMYKIDKIEQSQEQLVEKVDEIRIVLYDPDHGLYARIKNVENSSIDSERISLMEEEIRDMKSWKENEKKFFDKSENNEAQIEKKIEEHNEIIKEIQRWYQKQAALSKWLGVTIGTSVLGLLIKFAYDYLINHVKFI